MTYFTQVLLNHQHTFRTEDFQGRYSYKVYSYKKAMMISLNF